MTSPQGLGSRTEEKTLKRLTIACIALVGGVLLLSASLASAAKPADLQGGGKSVAAKECAAEKKADKAAFREKYGEHAMRECIKGGTASGDGVTAAEAKNAAKECKAERAEDPAAFALAYGSNKNGKNAFGKCVSSKVDDDDEADENDEVEDEVEDDVDVDVEDPSIE